MLWVVWPGSSRLVVKRSVFTGVLVGIHTPQDRARVLDEAAVRFPEAGHVAFALRATAGEEQLSDAGEPGGTAGRPLLELLRRHEIERAMLLVARRYGGVNLGRPGLYRAYLGAGEAAVTASRFEPPQSLLPIRVALQYADYEIFQHQFPALVGVDAEVRFTDVVDVVGRLPEEDGPRLQAFLTDRGYRADHCLGDRYISTLSPRRVLEWPELQG